MKKVAKWILIGLAAAIVLLLTLVPTLLPPIVQRLAETKLAEFGIPAGVRMNLGYVWRNGPELAGALRLNLLNSPVQASADFGVGFGEWHAQVQVPQTELTEADPLVEKLLSGFRLPEGVSNLAFSVRFSLDACAARTRQTPVPVWSAKLPIRDTSVRLIKEDKPIAVDGLAVTLGASGIADHLDIAPMFLRIRSADAQGFALTNLMASIRATEKSLLVTEARAGVCGGSVTLYSLFLDPKTLNAGFTLFMEDIDAGDILSHFKGCRAAASGKLHGKLRLFLKLGGKSIRFSDAFLYSTPGETGKLKMTDAGVVTDNLALAGMDAESCGNVANALTDLDYSVLKLDLRRHSDDAATLSVRLDGTATRGAQKAPVNLTINFNGKLEQILNTGLGLSNRLKGMKK